MALPTALLVKGLAGVGAVAGVVGGGFLIKELLKSEDPNEIIKDLGISGCQLENNQTKTQECELDEAKVKAINFTNKPTDPNTFQISGLDSSKKLKLVIEKGYQDSDFPSGLRFTFTNSNNSDVTIGSGSNGSEQITLKTNTSYDFKITSDGTKLEKAWTLKSLAAKVGISCSTDTESQCDISEGGLNFWTSDTDYLTQGKNSESNKKITVAKETSNYFEGLKFTVSQDITLTTTGSPTKTKQLTNSNKTYEIALKDTNKTKTWFLMEKSTAA